MAWKFIYEDLAEYSSDTHTIDDLPLAGCQGVVVDGKPYTGLDEYGVLPDGTVVGARGGQKVADSYPDAKVMGTRTIPTRQFHLIEKQLGLWSPDNREPFQGWNKDTVGWRVWHSNSVVDSKGIPESGWRQHWIDNVNDGDVQEVTLYENWFASPGEQYRQYLGGFDNYYLADTPYGVVISSTNDPVDDILAKHPDAIIKTGKLLPRAKFDKILAAQQAATLF